MSNALAHARAIPKGVKTLDELTRHNLKTLPPAALERRTLYGAYHAIKAAEKNALKNEMDEQRSIRDDAKEMLARFEQDMFGLSLTQDQADRQSALAATDAESQANVLRLNAELNAFVMPASVEHLDEAVNKHAATGAKLVEYKSTTKIPTSIDKLEEALGEAGDDRARKLAEKISATRAPRPAEDAKRLIRNDINHHAAQATIGLREITSRKGNGTIDFGQMDHDGVLALLCFVHGDKLADELFARVEDLCAKGMTDFEVAARVKTLDAELVALERREADLWFACRRAGLDVPLRHSNPLAILGIELSK